MVPMRLLQLQPSLLQHEVGVSLLLLKVPEVLGHKVLSKS